MNDEFSLYVTEATFRQITAEVMLPKDFLNKDSLIWESFNTDNAIGNSLAYSDIKIQFPLVFKTICNGVESLNLKAFKRIQVQDSLRYLSLDENPCYHFDEDCKRLHANYDISDIKIPEVYLNRYSQEEKEQRAIEYRRYYKSLLREYNDRYGILWMDDKKNLDRFAFRVSNEFAIPVTDVFDRDFIGAPNSGVHHLSNDNIVYIKEDITTDFKRCWQEDGRRKLLHDGSWIFRKTWFVDNTERILCDISLCTKDDAVRLIELMDEVVLQLKNLSYIQYCPNLVIDEDLVQKIGLRSCNCTVVPTGEVAPFCL